MKGVPKFHRCQRFTKRGMDCPYRSLERVALNVEEQGEANTPISIARKARRKSGPKTKSASAEALFQISQDAPFIQNAPTQNITNAINAEERQIQLFKNIPVQEQKAMVRAFGADPEGGLSPFHPQRTTRGDSPDTVHKKGPRRQPGTTEQVYAAYENAFSEELAEAGNLEGSPRPKQPGQDLFERTIGPAATVTNAITNALRKRSDNITSGKKTAEDADAHVRRARPTGGGDRSGRITIRKGYRGGRGGFNSPAFQFKDMFNNSEKKFKEIGGTAYWR